MIVALPGLFFSYPFFKENSYNGVVKDIKFNSCLIRNWKMGFNKPFGLMITRREII